MTAIGAVIPAMVDVEAGSSNNIRVDDTLKHKQSPHCHLKHGITHSEQTKRVVHGVKVGFALVLVSLLFMFSAVHDRLGDTAMWAVMTVVVVLEFTAGATLNKGINRVIGTMVGGGIGSLLALLAQEIGGVGKAVLIGISVFIFGALATYLRMIPRLRKKYDYGAMIFILTFSLVIISGIRGSEILKIASDRLSSICLGFVICISVSLFVFPQWAGDELHESLSSKFHHIASSLEVICNDSTELSDHKLEDKLAFVKRSCFSILSSSSKDEVMANFAKCEPWHGRFGFSYPWCKYLEIGQLLRELTALVFSLNVCLHSKQKSSPSLYPTMDIEEQFKAISRQLATILRQIGGSIYHMKVLAQLNSISSQLEDIKCELTSITANFVIIISLEIMDKIQQIIVAVDELGSLARFDDI